MKSLLKAVVVSILTFEARMLLARTKPQIVAVTGSVGKTSTKDAISHVLKSKKRCRKSEKSYNSEIGVPLSVLGLENAWNDPWLWIKNLLDGMMIALWPGKYPEVLVLETGVDRPGDMKRLTAWLKPDIVVLTRLPDVPVHVEYFGSPAAVIAEKLTLVEALKSDGILVYNHDDEKVLQAAKSVRQTTKSYGRYSDADFRVGSDEVIYEQGGPRGLKFEIGSPKGKASFTLSGAIGEGHFYNYAAAVAVADVFDIDIQTAAGSLEDFTPPPGRMRLIDGIKDTVIIDDTYNSSPVALEKALTTLSEIKGFVRKVAILGDMLELGRFSIEEHEKAGRQAAKNVDVLVTVGIRSRGMAEGALESGLSEKHVFQYEDTDSARREIQNLIQPGDLILIKGSQGLRMERIVEEIMKEPDAAPDELVRQSRAWKNIS